MPHTIYKITTPHHDKCYIGCTRRSIEQRYYEHLAEYAQWKNGTRLTGTSSSMLLVLGDCSIEKLEEVSSEDAAKREREYIDSTPCVNIQRPLFTRAEWLRTDKGLRWERNRRRKVECEHCGARIVFNNIQRHKRTKKCLAVQNK